MTLTPPVSLPCSFWAFCEVRHGERFFSLQERNRELPLADGCARPRVGKPDAGNSVAPPFHKERAGTRPRARSSAPAVSSPPPPPTTATPRVRSTVEPIENTGEIETGSGRGQRS